MVWSQTKPLAASDVIGITMKGTPVKDLMFSWNGASTWSVSRKKMPGAIFAMPAWKPTFVTYEIHPCSVVVAHLEKGPRNWPINIFIRKGTDFSVCF